MKNLFILYLFLVSCAQVKVQNENSENIYFSSRDLNVREQNILAKFYSEKSREPANIKSCFEGIGRFLTPHNELTQAVKNAPEEVAVAIGDKATQANLLKLSYEELEFKNGKSYIALNASKSALERNYEYDKFLEKSIEVIYVPYEPFGHITIRVGKYVYAFNAVQRTMSTYFRPIIHPNRGPDKSSFGFIFMMDREKIVQSLNAIEAIFKNSQEYNMPPFDAYSALLKLEEIDHGIAGKKIRYVSDSPKLANNAAVSGRVVEIDGKYFLQASNGYKVPIIKRGKQLYVQSYSCSTVVSKILKDYFGITIGQDVSAKYTLESLRNGNLEGNRSPDFVMRYYEEN